MRPRVLCILCMCGMLAGMPLHVSAEILDQQALELANKEIVKFYVDPRHWTAQIDKTLNEWSLKRHSWEEWMKNTNETWPRRRINEIESAIKDKKVWLVVYDLPVPPGERILHTHAIVFLDAKTGDILAVINPEE